MPLPLIAIEIAAPATARGARPDDPGGTEVRRTLLASCEAAVAEAAECVIATSEQEATVLALVFWRGPNHIRVEVGLGSSRVPWAIRELEFSSRDPAMEKWRTVGYTVGSLAGEALAADVPRADGSDKGEQQSSAGESEQEKRANGTSAAAAAEPGKSASPQSVVTEAAAAPSVRDAGAVSEPVELDAGAWSLAAAALVGPGVGPVRVGGSLRVNRAFHGPYATAAGTYAIDVADSRHVSAQRFALSAGGGYEWAPGYGFAIAVRGELMAEFLAAHVDDPLSGRSDGRSRWSAALNAGLEVVRTVTGPVSVFVGMDATIRTNRTDIHVGSVDVASAPMADVTALLGARFALR